jgi:hypothetical protein
LVSPTESYLSVGELALCVAPDDKVMNYRRGLDMRRSIFLIELAP